MENRHNSKKHLAGNFNVNAFEVVQIHFVFPFENFVNKSSNLFLVLVALVIADVSIKIRTFCALGDLHDRFFTVPLEMSVRKHDPYVFLRDFVILVEVVHLEGQSNFSIEVAHEGFRNRVQELLSIDKVPLLFAHNFKVALPDHTGQIAVL